MVAPNYSPVGKAVLDDIMSCAADLDNCHTRETLHLAIGRAVVLSHKINQLHSDGLLTEREYAPLNITLLVIGLRSMNRFFYM